MVAIEVQSSKIEQNINKSLVAKRFQSSTDTYQESAIIQKEMAIYLAQLIKKYKSDHVEKVLEIGCGTGFLTEKINTHSFQEFWVNDLVFQHKNRVQNICEQAHFIGGDIENISIPNTLNLIISGATFQWITEPISFFRKLYKHLAKDGLLCFSSFGINNFKEIKQLTKQGLHYFDQEEYQRLLDGFQILEFHEKEYTLYFESVKHLLKHIKETGVNGLNQNKWSIAQFKVFEKTYEAAFRTEKGIPLTYHSLFIVAKKSKECHF